MNINDIGRIKLPKLVNMYKNVSYTFCSCEEVIIMVQLRMRPATTYE